MAEPSSRCLTVVMPCYNEAATVKDVIERVLGSPYTAELVIVDDGSTDGTRELLRGLDNPRIRVFEQPVNLGKGAALRRGFAEATSPLVIVQDADLEYDPSDYGEVLEPLLDNRADVVYGSRFHTSRPRRVLYFWHSAGNRFLTLLSNMFANVNLTDMETCYKAFRREVLESFEIEEDRFGFEPEITAKIAAGGWRLYEVGISYAGRTYAEGKKIGWRDGLRAAYCVVRYAPTGSRLAAAAASRRRHATFDEADSELADTLHNLETATNYGDWIVGLMAPHLGEEILEVGAGHGTLTERLARHGRVTASEPSKRAVVELRERLRDRPDITVVEADVHQAARLRQFDSAVLVNVLEHIPDDIDSLRALRAGLRPGGTIAVFSPAFDLLYSDFDRKVGHHRRYRRSSLSMAMSRAGLEVVDIRYVNAPGALAWLVFARVLRQVPTKSWSVTLFDRLVVPVARRVEARRQPPVGQSVLCIARRPLEEV